MTNNGDWRNLYSEGWNSEIVPEAFSHPAKFSRALIRHIYQHAVENGWLKPGDICIDPFGGVALGALDAMRQGLNWVGVELEARFVELGNKNIELWNERYSKHFPGWGTAKLVQGDSRQLLGVIAGVDCAISSPPFGKAQSGGGIAIHGTPKTGEYSQTGGYKQDMVGTTPGNLGNLPAGEIDGVVSSPPYANAINQHGEGPQGAGDRHGNISPTENAAKNIGQGYGTTPGNLGNSENTTFWEAARVIVDQTYAALKPGGVAIWVTKAFVKNKQRVDFPGQWRRMCEAAGFVTVCEHKAWLVEDRGAQYDLFGELVEKTVERKSFFRRLAEKKGSPRIDWETVTCQVKPGATGGVVDGVVSSPPYSAAQAHPSIGSVNNDDWGNDGHDIVKRRGLSAAYGDTPGNIGNMKGGDYEDL